MSRRLCRGAITFKRPPQRTHCSSSIPNNGVDPSARKRVPGNRVFAMPIGDAGDSGLCGVDL
jgi:hypothetical protein